MKMGFGWFFLIMGVLNIFRGLIMIADNANNGGGILIIAIVFIALGGWMIDSSKPKESLPATKVEPSSDNSSQNQNKGKKPNGEQMNINLDELTMHIVFREKIKEEFDKAVVEVFHETKDDDLLIGLNIQLAIATTCQSLKQIDFLETGITKEETDSIIDEITKQMLHKYLKGY